MAIRYCPNCGAPVESYDTVCPKCGAPLDDGEDTLFDAHPYAGLSSHSHKRGSYREIHGPHHHHSNSSYSDDNTNGNNHGNNRLVVILLAVLLCLLVVGGVVAFVIYSNNKRAAEQERTEAELKEKEESIEELSRTNDSLKAANARKPKTVTKVIVEHHQTPQSATSNRPTRVVINGTGVRMRLGPGTEYDYPVTSSGRAYTVPKGTSLPYLGESGNWNKVMFEGSAYWVSKDFSYLQ